MMKIAFYLKDIKFRERNEKSIANIYFREPIIAKVSRTFIFANQRKRYRVVKICLPCLPLKTVE